MEDRHLINRARKLVNKPRPLSIHTVSELNVLYKHLRCPESESAFDELYRIAVADMNVANSWGKESNKNDIVVEDLTD